jgi:hypothetical protein
MYGMITQAVRDLVIQEAGEDAWLSVCCAAAIDPEGFEALTAYPDEVTFRLVGAAAEQIGVSSEEILRRFGRHWVRYTAEHGYREIMRMFGRDFRACLSNLNRMHGHMGGLMPELKPPRFTVLETSPTTVTLDYYSVRQGLAPMVVGLLEGLAEKFGERIRIEAVPGDDSACCKRFNLSFV